MAKKQRKVNVQFSREPKKTKIKTDVRLIKAEDAIWMSLDDRERSMLCVGTVINVSGFRVELRENGAPQEDTVTIAMSWWKVAYALGKEVCEYCLNADGQSYVLLYDVMEVES